MNTKLLCFTFLFFMTLIACQQDELKNDLQSVEESFYLTPEKKQLIEIKIKTLLDNGLLPSPTEQELREFEKYLFSDDFVNDLPIESKLYRMNKSNLCDRNKILQSLESPFDCLSTVNLWRGYWIIEKWDKNGDKDIEGFEFSLNHSSNLRVALSKISPFIPTDKFDMVDLRWARSLFLGIWDCGPGYACGEG